MKRMILTLAAVLVCALAFGQKKVFVEEGRSSIYTYEGMTESYAVEVYDDLLGQSITMMFVCTRAQLVGFFDILQGIMAGKYPPQIALPQGGGCVSFYYDEKYKNFILDQNGTNVILQAATIEKFKAGMQKK